MVDGRAGWPTTIETPVDARNVLLLLYGSNSVFGGIVLTPARESLARRGLAYTQMHNTALCSSTRAALLTRRNHHTVHIGTAAEGASGYSGYDSVIPPETAHVAKTLQENGYPTAWFGKNHNVPIWEATPGGPFSDWPDGQGYHYFYGCVGGDTSHWQPVWATDCTYNYFAVLWDFMPYRVPPSILNRSYRTSAEIEVPQGGANGGIRNTRRTVRRLWSLLQEWATHLHDQANRRGATEMAG